MAERACAETERAELADRIGLAELRLARLRTLHQRMQRQGADTFRIERQTRHLERSLREWRDQQQALRAEVTG